MLETLKKRTEWCFYALTPRYAKFILTGYIPDVIFHTRAQDHEQVTEHYDTGNDFFNWYLGPRMVYTSGYFLT